MGNLKTNSKERKVVSVRVPESIHKKITKIAIDTSTATGEIHLFSDALLSVIEKGLESYNPSKSVA